MKLTFKRHAVRLLLAVLRILMLAKRHGGPVLRMIARQAAAVWGAFMRLFGVPVYRFAFFLKRQSSKVILPAKSRLAYVVSNRYSIHAAMVGVAAVAVMASMTGSEVRAETFGTQSILYRMLSGTEQEIEVITASEGRRVAVKPVSYMPAPILDPEAHIDLNYLGEEYVTPVTGGAVIAQQPITDSGEPVAVRETTVAYAVQEGDTLSGIATKHGLSLSTVLWANDLTFRSTIQPGQELRILPVDGIEHPVKSGDSVLKLAQTYGADAEQVIRYNKLANADDLRIGETLVLPGGERPAPVVQRSAPVSSLFTPPAPRAATPSSPSAGSSAPRGSSAGSGNWVWPTDWRVITQYYGWRHTGLDIDGDYSTWSYAAADGVVIYSGWRSGYGLTIEVDHGNGITTRYAHHSKNNVGVGDVVTAGQILAQTGTTGRSTGTHLHFEVIKNGKFQNPLDWVR